MNLSLFRVLSILMLENVFFLNPDTYRCFYGFGGMFEVHQARSPSPGDRARPDGFAAQAILMRHHEPESNSVMESSFMTVIYTSQIVPKCTSRRRKLRVRGKGDSDFDGSGATTLGWRADVLWVVGIRGLIADSQRPDGFCLLFEE